MPAGAFAHFHNYGPATACLVVDDAAGMVQATASRLISPELSVVGTGTVQVMRPYRGYAARLSVSGDSFAAITPHQLMKVKMTVNVGAVPSAEDIAQSIWNSTASKYNYANTMGNKLNAAGSGGVDYTALGVAVWNSVTRTLTSGGGSAPTAAEIVSAIEAAVVPVNIKQVNDVTIKGVGAVGNEWGPV